MLRFVAFDMDGTLVDVDSSWGYVHRYFGDENSEALKAFNEDRIDDEEFIRRDIRIWWKHRPGLTAQELEAILDGVPLMPGAKELCAGLQARGIWTAIVSGGIDLLARRVGRELGIQYVLANGCRVDSTGRLTGEGVVRVPIKRKEEVLAGIQRQLAVEPADCAAVGNSEIDVGMFRRSRIGVAFRPADAHVRESATFVVEGPSMSPILEHLLAADVPSSARR